MRRPQKAFFLLCFRFSASLQHFKDGAGCHGDSFVQSFATAAFRKASTKRKWKPGLHHRQFWAGPQELILLCLIKLKWEFIFAEEATVKTGPVKFVALSEEQHFLDVFLAYSTHYWRRRARLPVAQRPSQISSHKNLPFARLDNSPGRKNHVQAKLFNTNGSLLQALWIQFSLKLINK